MIATAGFYKASGSKILKDAEMIPRLVRHFMVCRLAWRPIASEAIDVWTPGLLIPSARSVSGAAGCQWRRLLTTGIRPRNDTVFDRKEVFHETINSGADLPK